MTFNNFGKYEFRLEYFSKVYVVVWQSFKNF